VTYADITGDWMVNFVARVPAWYVRATCFTALVIQAHHNGMAQLDYACRPMTPKSWCGGLLRIARHLRMHSWIGVIGGSDRQGV
jgi:hypothetical protein